MVDETLVKTEVDADSEMKDAKENIKLDDENSKEGEVNKKDEEPTKTEGAMEIDAVDLTSPVTSKAADPIPTTASDDIPPPSATSDLRDMDFDDLFEDLSGTGAATATDANAIEETTAVDLSNITPSANEVPDVSALLPSLETFPSIETSMPAPEPAATVTADVEEKQKQKKDDPPLDDIAALDANIGDIGGLDLSMGDSSFNEQFDFGDFNNDANAEDSDFLQWFNTES
jgi:hypothetical protein